jgi:hypothetical protein
MKTLFEKLKSRKFWTSLAVSGVGVYLISQGHVEAGTALLGVTQTSYNIGQGMADAKKAAIDAVVKSAINQVSGQN